MERFSMKSGKFLNDSNDFLLEIKISSIEMNSRILKNYDLVEEERNKNITMTLLKSPKRL